MVAHREEADDDMKISSNDRIRSDKSAFAANTGKRVGKAQHHVRIHATAKASSICFARYCSQRCLIVDVCLVATLAKLTNHESSTQNAGSMEKRKGLKHTCGEIIAWPHKSLALCHGVRRNTSPPVSSERIIVCPSCVIYRLMELVMREHLLAPCQHLPGTKHPTIW